MFSKDQFPDVYVPTVFENYVADIEVDGKQVQLICIWLFCDSKLDNLFFFFWSIRLVSKWTASTLQTLCSYTRTLVVVHHHVYYYANTQFFLPTLLHLIYQATGLWMLERINEKCEKFLRDVNGLKYRIKV